MSPLVPLVALFAISTVPSAPHDPGLSSIRVTRDGASVHVHAAFANADFRLATGIDTDRDGAISVGELAGSSAELRELANSQFTLHSGDGERGGRLVAARIAENADVELDIEFDVGGAGNCRLRVPLLQRLSRGHCCYCSLVEADAVIADALLRPTTDGFDLPLRTASAGAGFTQSWSFFVLGIEHILTGFDHLAFLLALLAAGIGWRRVLATITAFTVAHSITLLAAALGLVRLPSMLVEATIAASIVVVAIANVWQRDRRVHRWPLAFVFGLVHGFGFAGVLADLAIGGPDMLLPLVNFNVGVEVGQLAFALVVVPLLAIAARSSRGRHVPLVISIATGTAGVLWLFQRLTGA